MKTTLEVSNIKCGGCAKTITSKLERIDGVTAVDVDIEHGKVSFESESDLKDKVANALKKMGYPQGESGMVDSAKSYVSCMVGRLK